MKDFISGEDKYYLYSSNQTFDGSSMGFFDVLKPT